MRKVLVAFFVLLNILIYAQIPNGYYDDANGLTGEALKSALNDIIDGHTEFPYTSSSTDVWDILTETDRDPDNSDNVICIYSGFSRNAESEFDNGSGWNREHIWPQSRGEFGTSRGAGTDVHHIRAADVSTNSARSNRNFVASCETQYVDGDGITNSFTCSSVFGWEPRDEVKGDVSRMLFYMATRYEGENGELDLELTEELQTQGDTNPLHATLSVLLSWHESDPVSQIEIDRNDIIFSFQGNRNPYIDHPEYVNEVFGGGPSISLSETSFDFGVVLSGQNSSSKSYLVSGNNLESDITLQVNAPFELSLNNSTWAQSISVNQSNAESGTNNIVFARFSPIVSNEQSFSENITHTATNATTVNLLLSGKEGDGTTVGAIELFQSFENTANDSWAFTQSPEAGTLVAETDIWGVVSSLNNIDDLPSHGNMFFGGQDINNPDNTSGMATLEFETVSLVGNVNCEISFDYQVVLFDSPDFIEYSLDGGNSFSTLFSGQVEGDGASFSGSETIVIPESITTLSFQIRVTQDGGLDFCGFDNFQMTGELPTVIWDGSESTDWFEANNWQGGEIPNASDDVLIENTGMQPVVSGDAQMNDLTINAGASLLVNSGSSLAIFGSADGNGQVILERNVTGNLGYSIVGSPITSALISDLEPDFSLRFNGDFEAYNGAIVPGEGYFLAFNSPSPKVSFLGIPNSGTINYPVTNGFQVIANPYASAISINAFQDANASTTDGTIYFWDDGGVNDGENRSGSYVTVNDLGVVGTVNDSGLQGTGPASNGFIGSMQGVFVNVVDDANSITFLPTMQTTTSNANTDDNFYRSTSKSELIMRIALIRNATKSDMIIGFLDEASTNQDYGLDALRLDGSSLLYSLQGDVTYVIQALPLISSETEIKLGIEVPDAGSYQFETTFDKNDLKYELYLVDTQLNEKHVLTNGGFVNLTLDSGINEERFRLLVSPILLKEPMVDVSPNEVIVFPNPTNGDFHLIGDFQKNVTAVLFDITGRSITNVNASKEEVEAQLRKALLGLSPGQYSLRLQNEGVSSTIKIIRQ